MLFQIPRDSVAPGSGANQLNNPRDIAGDPDTGHVFISQFNQHRIGEFTAWGEFVKAWGWDVSPEGAPGDTDENQLEVCTTICQAGTAGSGPGQLRNPTGVTVDDSGNIYVYDGGITENRRVQKFSPTGQFLLMFGDGVNQGPTNPGDVCTAAHVLAGDSCGPGTGGNGPAQLENTLGNFIAYGAATNSIFVGDTDMIQEFNVDGTFKGAIHFEGALEAFDGRSVTSLDADLASNLYIGMHGVDNVHKLSPSGGGVPLATFPVRNPFAVAVDRKGVGSEGKANGQPNVYAIESDASPPENLIGARVLGFQASGTPIGGMEREDGFGAEGGSLIGLGTNLCADTEVPGNLYVSYFTEGQKASVNAYGMAPISCEPPPSDPPQVGDEYATAVDTEGAVVRAEIDPNLRNDTTFFVEYCLDEGLTSGCQTTAAVKLTAITTDFPLTTHGVFLGGLNPGTTYYYRFVAQSSGGGPTFGAGNSFRTFARQTAPPCAANAHLRSGAAAVLPDCRAYEMVSPLDKNNGDIRVHRNPNLYPVSLFQAAATGGGFTYSSSIAFGEPEGAPLTTQYLARRDPAQGWVSETISPPRTRQVGAILDTEFRQFSEDLCQAWLRHDSDPPLTGDAVPGYFNLYRIDYCAGGGYEALTTEKPPSVPCNWTEPAKGICPAEYFLLELQGTSADGSKAIYVAPDNLAGAPENTNTRVQLYVFADGKLSFACILPGGSPSTQGCAAGTSGTDHSNGRLPSLYNAISADGSVLYWSEGPKNVEAPGIIDARRLFVRVHPAQGPMGAAECTAPDKACTYPISTAIAPGDRSRFWGAADDGSKAIYTIETGALADNLYRFELAKAKAKETASTLIAEGVKGVLGMSEDATRVYFVSTKDLDGEGEAQPDQANLYLHEAGEPGYDFIGALAANDLGVDDAIMPAHKSPVWRASRVTADGSHAAFVSRAPLTGYDNRDVLSGERDTEVFLYDAGADELVCASCNPSGARPSGRQIDLDRTVRPWISARIPGWERSLYPSRVLSEDGQRLFFESFGALVPRDTNGEQDVYQWEAVGKGDCDEGDSGFAPKNGGCVELISSGESARESNFRDASASGDDVFFTTLSSLVPQDFGLIDVYDARVGGGFPPPPAARPPCEGEACQSPPAPPELADPASRTFEGSGDAKPSARKRRCAKGKRRVVRKGKVRCVRKKKGAKQRKGAQGQGKRAAR